MPATANWNVAPMLGVRDVRKSADYYQSVLGFHCAPDGIFGGVGDEGAVYAILRREGILIHLQIRRRPLHLDARQDHEGDAYFYVGDVDALYAEYRQRNVKIHRPLQDEEYGVRDFTIETPDGHRLAFGTPTRS